jgi:hypothetical protein
MMSPKVAVAVPRLVAALLAVAVLGTGTARACVGVECLLTWSTQDGGGALTLQYNFATSKVQTFRARCEAGECLYSGTNPGFLNTGDNPPDGSYILVDGTSIGVEIVDIDAGARMKINDAILDQPGESAPLGTTPELHTHPSWQLKLPEGEQGDYSISFKLTTDSTRYSGSAVFSVVLTNLPTPTPDAPTPTASLTPTATAALPDCAGDCDGDGAVAVNELILGVRSALEGEILCAACERDGDGAVSISELVGAVNSALSGCPLTPTPTATVAASLEAIQRTIFSPRCAIPICHTAQANSGNLVLEAGSAGAQLVGVEPFIDTARAAGLLRVDPGHPENSFLLVKLEGPPPDQGSRMPLTGALLTASEIQLIRDWIAAGAPE